MIEVGQQLIALYIRFEFCGESQDCVALRVCKCSHKFKSRYHREYRSYVD